MAVGIPFAGIADHWLRELATSSGSAALTALDGATLLSERARLGGYCVPATVSAGGGCRFYAARGGHVAINLSRADDRASLPALFAVEGVTVDDLPTMFAMSDAAALVARGRLLGFAIAGEKDRPAQPAHTMLTPPTIAAGRAAGPPRVLDLSALWAGPLAARLLALAGAAVTRVDSRRRTSTPSGVDVAFERLLAQDVASVTVDLAGTAGRAALLGLIANADIVIEAARPRALRQLGIDADAIVATRPGLIWLTITAHGASGEAADWVGFGDDGGVAAGLSAALRVASGRIGFVGDAIADPLTGIRAAAAAHAAWSRRIGGRIGIAMTGVAADALALARRYDAATLDRELVAWADAAGLPFASVTGHATAAPC